MQAYILKHRKPIVCDDKIKFIKFFSCKGKRRVRSHRFANGVWVSTVFLALDHNFAGGPPLLFETMAFDGDFEELTRLRCSTWRQALEQHRETLKVIKNYGKEKRETESPIARGIY